jgi:sialate O-acetylesterase
MEIQHEPVQASSWPELREAQSMTLSLPGTGMAVITDIGEAGDIHPRNKQDVGYRLALAALNHTYNRDNVYSGPTYESMEREDYGIRLTFDNVGSGMTTAGDGPPLGFAIAGEDSVFHWANVIIEPSTILVSSPAVPNPVAVRYNWADNPVGNLINEEGLPASLFRTDDWPAVTRPR